MSKIRVLCLHYTFAAEGRDVLELTHGDKGCSSALLGATNTRIQAQLRCYPRTLGGKPGIGLLPRALAHACAGVEVAQEKPMEFSTGFSRRDETGLLEPVSWGINKWRVDKVS